jgi:hypothetical protein
MAGRALLQHAQPPQVGVYLQGGDPRRRLCVSRTPPLASAALAPRGTLPRRPNGRVKAGSMLDAVTRPKHTRTHLLFPDVTLGGGELGQGCLPRQHARAEAGEGCRGGGASDQHRRQHARRWLATTACCWLHPPGASTRSVLTAAGGSCIPTSPDSCCATQSLAAAAPTTRRQLLPPQPAGSQTWTPWVGQGGRPHLEGAPPAAGPPGCCDAAPTLWQKWCRGGRGPGSPNARQLRRRAAHAAAARRASRRGACSKILKLWRWSPTQQLPYLSHSSPPLQAHAGGCPDSKHVRPAARRRGSGTAGAPHLESLHSQVHHHAPTPLLRQFLRTRPEAHAAGGGQM